MPTVTERISVVEVQVANLDEKLDEVKVNIKDMHDCLDITRDQVLAALKEQTGEYRDNSAKFYEHADKIEAKNTKQHDELYAKVNELEKTKNKFTMYAMVFLAFAAGTGWLNTTSFPHILKFLGL